MPRRLGVKNLKFQALTLRVLWEWLRRTDHRRPWHGLALMIDTEARVVFDSLVGISVSHRDTVLFRRDRWIHGFSVADFASNLISMIDTRSINHRTVDQVITGERWLQDVHGDISS